MATEVVGASLNLVVKSFKVTYEADGQIITDEVVERAATICLQGGTTNKVLATFFGLGVGVGVVGATWFLLEKVGIPSWISGSGSVIFQTMIPEEKDKEYNAFIEQNLAEKLNLMFAQIDSLLRDELGEDMSKIDEKVLEGLKSVKVSSAKVCDDEEVERGKKALQSLKELKEGLELRKESLPTVTEPVELFVREEKEIPSKSEPTGVELVRPEPPENIEVEEYTGPSRNSVLMYFDTPESGEDVSHIVSVRDISGPGGETRTFDTIDKFAVISGLSWKKSYMISVHSKRHGISSEKTFVKEPFTPKKPGPVENVTVEKNPESPSSSLIVSFTCPEPDVSDYYEVEAKDVAEPRKDAVTERAIEERATLHGLQAGRCYQISVHSVLGDNRIAKAAASSVIQLEKHKSVENLKVQRNPGSPSSSLIVSYKRPEPEVSDCYKVEARNTSDPRIPPVKEETGEEYATLEGLLPGNFYEITVYSIKNGSVIAKAVAANAIETEKLKSVENLKVQRKPGSPCSSLIVSYKRPELEVADCYKVEARNTSDPRIPPVKEETGEEYATLEGLLPGNCYEITVYSIKNGSVIAKADAANAITTEKLRYQLATLWRSDIHTELANILGENFRDDDMQHILCSFDDLGFSEPNDLELLHDQEIRQQLKDLKTVWIKKILRAKTLAKDGVQDPAKK